MCVHPTFFDLATPLSILLVLCKLEYAELVRLNFTAYRITFSVEVYIHPLLQQYCRLIGDADDAVCYYWSISTVILNVTRFNSLRHFERQSTTFFVTTHIHNTLLISS